MIFAHAALDANSKSAACDRNVMMVQTEATLADKKWHQDTDAISFAPKFAFVEMVPGSALLVS